MKSTFSDAADRAASATPSDAWPGVETSYRIGGTADRPELTVTVSARPDWLVPGPDVAAQATVALAGEPAGRYRLSGARLDQAGSTVSLLSSLTGDLAMPVTEDAPALRRFARSAELFAGAMAAATSPPLSGIATLGELLDRYGLSPEQLAAANADRPLTGLLAAGQDLARRPDQGAPDTIAADAGTLAEVAARLRTSPGRLLADNRGLRLAAEPTAVLPGRITLPAETRIPYPVQDGDTLAVLARRFATTPRELVSGNAEVAGTLLPGIRVEIPVASGSETALTGTDTLAGDSFSAVCDRLASQRAGVSPDAVADALDRLGPVLSPGPVLSCPAAVLGSGSSTDPVTGADVQAEYGCSPHAFAEVNAAVLGLLHPGVQLELDGASTTTAEYDTLHSVLERLAGDGPRPTIDRLLAGADGLPLFRAGARALLPPVAGMTLAVALGPLDLVAPAVPLVLTLRLAGGTAAEQADIPISPSADRDAFVDGCLTALPALRLATDAADAWWAVSFDERGIAVARVEPAAGGATAPRAFALLPLYPAPVGFSVAIRPVTERGEFGEPVVRAYSGVDVEPWARRLLTDLDGYLAEPLLGRLPEAAATRLRDCRRQLFSALAGWLVPLQPDAGPGADAALRSARAALAAAARTGLAEAYAVPVLAQYRAVVVSPYGVGGRPPAALLATVQDPERSGFGFSSSRIELDSSTATCTFGVIPAEPEVLAAVAGPPGQLVDRLEIGGGGSGEVLLRFARPLTGDYRVEAVPDDLPPVELPVPLREQPAPVSASPMTTQATFAGPAVPTLAKAVQWTAGLGYRHQHAAQDVVRISLHTRSTLPKPGPGNTGLAEALAGYLDAASQLIALIGPDAPAPDRPDFPDGPEIPSSPAPTGTDSDGTGTGTDADNTADGPVRDAAVASLLSLVDEVTAAWQRHRVIAVPAAGTVVAPAVRVRYRTAGRDLEAGFSGDYRLRAVYTADGRLDRLVVSRTAVAGTWPDITVAGPDEFLSLTPEPVLGNSREYTVAGSPITSPLTVRLGWPGLVGAPEPAAQITVTVERNTDLPGRHPVDPALVLTAQPVQVAIPSPSLRWQEEIALPGINLVQALRNAVDVLAVGQPEQLCGFEVRYVELFNGLPIERPALLGELVLEPNNAVQLAASMRRWQSKVRPDTAGATWQLRFTVPSAKDGDPPLLTFDRLVLPVEPG